MYRALISILIVLLLVPSLFAAEVSISAEVFESHTVFTYNIDMKEDSVNSFSLEKLSDSKVQIAKGDENDLSYTTAGDYFIFRTEQGRASEFELKIRSEVSSQQIFEKESFSHYVSFNFPINSLTFEMILIDNVGEIKEAFPRNFELSNAGGIIWEENNVDEDTLFLVNFENVISKNDSSENDFSYLILLLFLPILLFIILFYIVKKSPQEVHTEERKEEKKIPVKKPASKKKKKVVSKKKEIIKAEEQKGSQFEEIMNKYLTDNEKEVVKLVKENQGISQYDILNHLPTFTKSNLSKIISKLHAKKILNRIRVGKVNKIYLGERLEEKPQEEAQE